MLALYASGVNVHIYNGSSLSYSSYKPQIQGVLPQVFVHACVWYVWVLGIHMCGCFAWVCMLGVCTVLRRLLPLLQLLQTPDPGRR